MDTRSNQRIAFGTVRYIEKTYYGRAMIIAEIDDDHTRIHGYYPAVGADSVPFDVIIHDGIINSGQQLKRWVADNWHEVELAVAAARRRRYALRNAYLKQES